jgi:glycosyltransferase involved in cell wall biosynthesis
MTSAHICVIVPTFRRPALLRECIQSFDHQTDAPPFEMVVVDDGSGDDTTDVLRELEATRPWLKWSTLAANKGPATARNAAIARTDAPLLLFVDDDIVATPTLLQQHAAFHAQADDGRLAVLGRVDWHPSLTVSPFMRWLDRSGLQFAYDTWLREGPVDPPAAAFYTANLSLPRRLVLEAGGFDERFPFPAYEDIEFAVRLTGLGLHMDYRSAALAYHSRAIDHRTFTERMRRVGWSAATMRHIAPDFAIEDRDLVGNHVGALRRLVTRMRAAIVRDEASRNLHYWRTVAAAYHRGTIDAGAESRHD